ncbi:DNA-directed RNA polymerase subunit alpha [mine drainage metagenome]|uniref:DNA-directed RNA polymerase n=1 Tax=mine drainage metagenome TaxID=410659 RepID=T1AL64_9ZZZZ
MQAELIDHIRFTAISPDMIKHMSVAKIIVPDTYNDDGYPIDGGLIDQRLGVIDPGLKCKTCGGRAKVCPGHFGHIELVRPAIHPEFAKTIYLLLQSTCKDCHRILLNEKQVDDLKPTIESFVRADDNEKELSLQTSIESEGKNMSLIKKLKTVKKCPSCGAVQGKLKLERPTFFYMNGNRLKADEIHDWLASISNEDLAYLGIDGTSTRPEWFIMSYLLVPPVNVRPSITLESGERSEDDLTHKLVDIIRTNQRLEQDIDAGAPQIIIDDLWELLQYQVTTYFNNETPGVPVARHRSTRPLKTLAQRLKGKEGRLRYNLSGKRVNFSARTVITPDNYIGMDELGVPLKIAENLTVPLYVTKWNFDYAKSILSNSSYPMVMNHISKEGVRKRVADTNREELLAALKPGDILDRQLMDGDIVLFNRQPTLHRLSILAHIAHILPGNTFRLHLSATIPYNADFDGDEMNMHVPQTLEAQAEARLLMGVSTSIVSPRNGQPVMFAIEDIVVGMYMLTKDGASFTKDEAARLLSSVDIYELPEPLKNGTYSGKDIFSMILPEDLNFEYTDKKDDKNNVVIKKGKLIKGYVNSKIVKKGKLILYLYSEYGPEKAKDFIDSITIMAGRAAYIAGMSISMRDYYISALEKDREKIISNTLNEAKELLDKYRNKTLEALPGYTKKQTYELEVFATLNIARSVASQVLLSHLTMDNNAMLMIAVDARGNILNFVQIAMMLGQQSVRGGRPSRGYDGRVLPYFSRKDKNPMNKGFVKSNFVEGLEFVDYYMHAMGARDSAMGKPLVTAVSGYMMRRLVNAMQDFYIDSDLSVKDAGGALIETLYGGDGIDPVKENMK